MFLNLIILEVNIVMYADFEVFTLSKRSSKLNIYSAENRGASQLVCVSHEVL